ncbi:MAG: putative toxin-antitoxin system toxin component, PIN family, partial [Bryobacteraceae bacterium]
PSPRGAPARILAAWRDERFQLVVSAPILAEFERVLRYPKIAKRHGWSEEQLSLFLEDLLHLAILAPGEASFRVVAADPSDNHYLECAMEGAAAYIVSGDQHLPSLGGYKDIEILPPAAFLDVLGELAGQ